MVSVASGWWWLLLLWCGWLVALGVVFGWVSARFELVVVSVLTLFLVGCALLLVSG